jgi:hypothetical protein
VINKIIESISIALDAEFHYENHIEEIKQDLVPPCFFIMCLNPTSRLFFGKRYFRSNSFCIQYFPQSDEKQKECNDVAERMALCLEVITMGSDQIRGTKMKYEVVDGVLQFFINYDCFVYRVEATETMDTMGTSTSVKEGE